VLLSIVAAALVAATCTRSGTCSKLLSTWRGPNSHWSMTLKLHGFFNSGGLGAHVSITSLWITRPHMPW
jgi:hypothetical protein